MPCSPPNGEVEAGSSGSRLLLRQPWRPSSSRRRLLGSTATFSVSLAVTLLRTEQLSDAQRHVLGAMASGVSPRIPTSAQEDLGRVGGAHLRQIAERDGRAYFVSDLRGGGLCVTIRATDDPSGSWGYTCSPDFPSAARPLLDESVFWGLRGSTPEPRIVRLEGFADDSVASVGVMSADGRVEALTPVQDNVYLRTDDLPDGPVGGIVALDASGARVYDLCYVRGGCSPP
jgi:hypothetical protein